LDHTNLNSAIHSLSLGNNPTPPMLVNSPTSSTKQPQNRGTGPILTVE